MSRTELEREVLARAVDQIAALQGLDTRMAEIARQLAGFAANDVLFAGIVVLDDAGRHTADWRNPFGAVHVVNHGSAAVTVTTDSLQRDAPPGGPGSALIGAGTGAAINLRGHTLSFYGRPGERVTLAVLARPVAPAVGEAEAGPSDAVGFVAGTADAQLVATRGVLTGFTIRETTGLGAGAVVVLRDGVDATGVPLAVVTLIAGESVRDTFGKGVRFATGLFLDRISGTTEGSAFWRAL